MNCVSQTLASRGVTLRIATQADRERIWRFLLAHFVPHEPVAVSCGAVRNATVLDRVARDIIHKNGVLKCTSQPRTSLVAVNGAGELVGAKMGYYRKWEDPQRSIVDDLPIQWLSPLSGILPAQFSQFLALSRLMEHRTRYDAHMTMEDLGCKSIYVGDVMSVHSDYRGLGLGAEMVQQTIALAREHHCSHYMAVLTGKFSQAIYRQFSFQADRQWSYLEERDKYGRLVIDQPGEHTHMERVTRRVEVES